MNMVRVQYNGFPPDYYRTPGEAEAHVARSNELNPHHEPDEWTIDIVERESRPCRFCGTEVQVDLEKHPDTDWCRQCHYSGRVQEELLEPSLDAFRAAFPDWNIGAEHTGGGCFWLALYPPAFEEERGIFYIATDGEASLPEVANDGWGIVCRQSTDEESPDYEGAILLTAPRLRASGVGEIDQSYWDEYPAHCLTTKAVIEAILHDRLKPYTVLAVYADQPQRYATTVFANSAQEAEHLARDDAEAELLIAGVIEGEVRLADVEYVITDESDAKDEREEG